MNNPQKDRGIKDFRMAGAVPAKWGLALYQANFKQREVMKAPAV